MLDVLPDLPGGRLLCNTAGRAQFAAEFAAQHPSATATCWMLDLFQEHQTRAVQPPLANLRLMCAADPPSEPFDVVAWGFGRQGEGELVREMLQLGHERLAPGGQLVAALDYPRDQWLAEQLEKLFDKVQRKPHPNGVVYWASKTGTLRKLKNYAAEFAFRDGERLIHLRTRPGVFNHRELDGGARALIKAMQIEDGMRVLDIGCGCGAVGLAAALRSPHAAVTAIDSNPRAIEATHWGQERNRAENLVAALDCDGSSVAAGSYDLVLANPPYYSDFRIAELFVKTAARALRPGGQLLVVTKMAEWYAEHLPPAFANVSARVVGHYTVVSADKA